jgi:hypothetical protein
MKFEVTMTQVSKYLVEVEADDEDEAEKKAVATFSGADPYVYDPIVTHVILAERPGYDPDALSRARSP